MTNVKESVLSASSFPNQDLTHTSGSGLTMTTCLCSESSKSYSPSNYSSFEKGAYPITPSPILVTISPLETDICPEHGKWDWSHYRVGDQDYCYTVIPRLKSTWEDAQAMCNELGAGLVTIHSGDENVFVANLPGAGQGRWLGLTTNYKGGSFRWLDGSEMGEPPYLNFRKPGLNRDPITSATCIYMLTEGEWWWGSCDSRLSFTCKKPATGLQPSNLFLY